MLRFWKPDFVLPAAVGLWCVLSAAPTHADLVGYWTFDADSGTAISDLSGMGHGATLNGGAFSADTPAALAGGMSLDLTGGNNYAIVDQGDENDFDLGGAMAVSVWIKGWPDGSWEPFVSKRGESGQGWQIRRHSGNDEATFTLRGTSGGDDPRGNVSINDGAWHHVLGTFNGAHRELWIDGNLDRSDGDFGSIADTAARVVLGARNNSGDPTDIGNHSQIQIDDVAVFDQGLLPAQIAHLAAGGDARNLPAAGPPGWSVEAVDLADILVPATRVNNLGDADDLIAGTLPRESSFGTDGVAVGNPAFASFRDNGGSDSQFFAGTLGVEPPGVSGNADDYAVVFEGTLNVLVPGPYTFGSHDDDSPVRIEISLDGGSTFTDVFGTFGNSDKGTRRDVTSSPVDLPVGDVPFRYTVRERGGGAFGELFYGPGDLSGIPSNDDGAILTNFALVGDPLLGIGVSGVITATTYKGQNEVAHPSPGNLADADAVLAGTFGVPEDFRGTTLTNTINFLGGGSYAGDENIGVADGEDRIAIFATGLVEITEPGDYTFGVKSDDGFRLDFEDFDFTGFAGDGGTDIDANGDLIFDSGRGDADPSFGHVNLPAGFHRLNLTWWEGTGGESLELFAAPGTLDAFDANVFRLVGDTLSGGLRVVQEEPQAVIPEPASATLAALGFALLALWIRRRGRA